MKKATAASYLSILDKCLKQCGVHDFLAQINFDVARIHDPTAFLDLEEFNYIVKAAYQLSGCSYLGIVFGQHLSIANHGFLGYAALTSPTLRTAIQTLLNFLNTRTGLLHCSLHDNSIQQTGVEFKLLIEDKLAERFVSELAIVHLVHLRKSFTNTDAPCLRIDVAYKKPLYHEYYQQILGIPINFNQAATGVWFKSHELDCPMSLADDVSYQQAKAQLELLTLELNLKDELPDRIKKLLLEEDNFQLNMEQIASKLFLTPRTLRRHLQRYQVSYQDLLDSTREERAKQLLSFTSEPITEIALTLGFHDTSNFTKAFKRWTNLTPSEYRAQDKS